MGRRYLRDSVITWLRPRRNEEAQLSIIILNNIIKSHGMRRCVSFHADDGRLQSLDGELK